MLGEVRGDVLGLLFRSLPGEELGCELGLELGILLGEELGALLGDGLGCTDSESLGRSIGFELGVLLGSVLIVGLSLVAALGKKPPDGLWLRLELGQSLGILLGFKLKPELVVEVGKFEGDMLSAELG